MKVLVVDKTGRGHALCDLLTRTNPSLTVYYGPGSGVFDENRVRRVSTISIDDANSTVKFCNDLKIDFVIVSYIDSLAKGYVDRLRESGIQVIGPSKAGAALEASKAAGKEFCDKYGVKTAAYKICTTPFEARQYIAEIGGQVVIKQDGLFPNGDGARVCDCHADAEVALNEIERTSGIESKLIIEERLTGTEVSVFAFLGMQDYVLFPSALDYKRTEDGDKGKNCDGMGSIAPHPFEEYPNFRIAKERLVERVFQGLKADGIEYTGFLYLGAMLAGNSLYVLEINARFGDSEAEVVLPSVITDFASVCQSVISGERISGSILFDNRCRCSVAAIQGATSDDKADNGGWPYGDFTAGFPIKGLEDINVDRAKIFFAGVEDDPHRGLITAGGRVLHVVGVGGTPLQARENAYGELKKVEFSGLRYRSDIGEILPSRIDPGEIST